MRAFIALLGFSLFLSYSHSKEYLCYIPGGGGLSQYMNAEVGPALWERSVDFVALDGGSWGTVRERAQNVIRAFEKQVSLDPQTQCHFFSFSMGGVVIRYALNHLTFVNEVGQREALSARALSVTSFSTPHHGTPAADILNDFPASLQPGLEDLSLKNIKMFNEPSYKETYSPPLEEVPFYSYRNFISNKKEAPDWGLQTGFSFISTYFLFQLTPSWRMNDGLVPTRSMEFGQVLDARSLFSYGLPKSKHVVQQIGGAFSYQRPGDFWFSHDFLSKDLGLDIDAVDVFEAHYGFIKSN